MRQPAAAPLVGSGGLSLFTQAWLPDGPPRAAVVLVHGLGEHSERHADTARGLVDAGYAVHALDHRGHGRSQGSRALIRAEPGLADLDAFVERVSGEHPELPLVMLGHSLGGMLATEYAIRHGARLRGLILTGALARVDASPAQRAIVTAIGRVAPRAPLIALDPALLSRDPAVVTAYREDPLVHHGRIPAGTLADIARVTGGFPARAPAIRIPTLVMYGTADGLCDPAGSVMLGERIGAADVTVRAFPDLFHEILNEPERAEARAAVIEWLAARMPGAGG